MAFELAPIPHLDFAAGFTLLELLVNGFLYAIVLTALFPVLKSFGGEFRTGFRRGMDRD